MHLYTVAESGDKTLNRKGIRRERHCKNIYDHAPQCKWFIVVQNLTFWGKVKSNGKVFWLFLTKMKKLQTSKHRRQSLNDVSKIHCRCILDEVACSNPAQRELQQFFKCVAGLSIPRASFESCQNFGIKTDNFGSSKSPEFSVKKFFWTTRKIFNHF